MTDFLVINHLDASNRDFVSKNPLPSDVELVSWYEDPSKVLGLNFSSFPSYVSLLPATSSLAEKLVSVTGFTTISEAQGRIKELNNARIQESIGKPSLPPVPDYEKFLYLLSTDTSLPLECQPFFLLWKLSFADLVDDTKRWGFWAKMTGENKSYFVTDDLIAKPKAYAALCNVSLTPPGV